MSKTAKQPWINLKQQQGVYQNHTVLHDINLSLQRGERVALLGKSGAGKSTLLKILYQHSCDDNPSSNSNIAWIPQQLGLVDNLTSFHNIYIGQLENHNALYNLLNLIWPQQNPRQEIESLLEQFGLRDSLFKPVSALSIGQQQRVAILRAIYSGADIILADEPTSSLDGPMAAKVITAILNHSDTTVIALHDTELAMRFADRIIAINDGHIVLDDKPSNIDPAQLEPLYDH